MNSTFMRLVAAACLTLPTLAAAQTNFHTTSGNIDGNLCIGSECLNFADYGTNEITLRSNTLSMLFQDNSAVNNAPTNDWGLLVNDSFVSGRDYFSVRDVTNDRTPFAIEAGARNNAFYVDNTSRIGIGTMLPVEDLHIVTSDTPTIRLAQEGAFGDQAFDIGGNETNLFIRDVQANTLPVRLLDDTPNGMLGITSDGVGIRTNDPIGNIDIRATLDVNGDALIRTDLEVSGLVGIGLDTPEGKLHTRGDGTQLVYFESGDGGAVQMRFRSDSQNRRFLAVNNSNQVQTQMQFRDNEILFLGATSADEWLSVSAAGITTMGGTCNVNPCDRTFDPSYFEVEPIEERAAYMWEHMHLPAVGPTKAGEPINLTEKTTGMLHELEVAHIYIEQLNGELTELRDTVAILQEQMVDLQANP